MVFRQNEQTHLIFKRIALIFQLSIYTNAGLTGKAEFVFNFDRFIKNPLKSALPGITGLLLLLYGCGPRPDEETLDEAAKKLPGLLQKQQIEKAGKKMLPLVANSGIKLPLDLYSYPAFKPVALSHFLNLSCYRPEYEYAGVVKIQPRPGSDRFTHTGKVKIIETIHEGFKTIKGEPCYGILGNDAGIPGMKKAIISKKISVWKNRAESPESIERRVLADENGPQMLTGTKTERIYELIWDDAQKSWLFQGKNMLYMKPAASPELSKNTSKLFTYDGKKMTPEQIMVAEQKKRGVVKYRDGWVDISDKLVLDNLDAGKVHYRGRWVTKNYRQRDAMRRLNSLMQGRNLKTVDGRIYYSTKINDINPAGIDISHKHGIKYLEFTELPASLRKSLYYDPAEAQAYKIHMSKLKSERIRKLREERMREAKRSKVIISSGGPAPEKPKKPPKKTASGNVGNSSGGSFGKGVGTGINKEIDKSFK